MRLEELQGEVASLTRARDLSERAYKAGAIPLTDVLIADSQLLVARNDVEAPERMRPAPPCALSALLVAGGTYAAIRL